MRLSDGTVVGLCYSLGFGAAQLWTISTETGIRDLWPTPRAILEMVGWSLVFTLPVAAAVWSLDWALKGLDDQPYRGLHLSNASFLAIAWAATALFTFNATGAKRIQLETGRNIYKGVRPALIGAAIGMVLSGLYIFGRHFL